MRQGRRPKLTDKNTQDFRKLQGHLTDNQLYEKRLAQGKGRGKYKGGHCKYQKNGILLNGRKIKHLLTLLAWWLWPWPPPIWTTTLGCSSAMTVLTMTDINSMITADSPLPPRSIGGVDAKGDDRPQSTMALFTRHNLLYYCLSRSSTNRVGTFPKVSRFTRKPHESWRPRLEVI